MLGGRQAVKIIESAKPAEVPSCHDLHGLASRQGLEARWRLGEEELSPW